MSFLGEILELTGQGDPAPGDPARVRLVANHLGELSGSARFARTQLAALQRGELRSCWQGVAADAFALELETLPADLGKLERSLDHASTAVTRWANTLDQAQPEVERHMRQYRPAKQELDQARRDRDQALIAAGFNPAGAIVDAIAGDSELEQMQRRVDDANVHIRRIRNRVDEVRDDVNATARTVANLLEEASRLGIQNKSDWEKFTDWLDDLKEDLLAVLKFLDEIFEWLAPIVGIVCMIGSMIPGVGVGFAAAGLAFAAMDFALTGLRMALGDDEVGWADLLDDGIGLAFAAVGFGAAKAAQSARAAAAAGKAVPAVTRGGRAIELVDKAGDVVDVAEGVLLVADIAGADLGNTFDLVVDLTDGSIDGSDRYDDWANQPANAVEELRDHFGGGVSDGGGGAGGGEPGPITDPGPGPEPGPNPEPGPGPEPGPNPEPGPGPEPGPCPEPGPNPEPGPGPTPEPAPAPDPGPGTDPGPAPAPVLDPAPSPVAGGTGGASSGADGASGAGGGGAGGGGGTFAEPGSFDAGKVDPAPSSFEIAADLPPHVVPGDSTSSPAVASVDASARAAAEPVIGLATGVDPSGVTMGTVAAGGAAVVGLASAAAGAKRIADAHRDDDGDAESVHVPEWDDAATPVSAAQPIDTLIEQDDND